MLFGERGGGGGVKCTNCLEGGVTKSTNSLEGGVAKLLPGLNMWYIYIDLISLTVKIKESGGGVGGGLLSIYKYQPHTAKSISLVASL